MDGWIQNRRSDVRFFNEMRRVDMKKTHWYNSGQRFVITNHTFAAKSDSNPDPTIKKKKMKKKKKTESGNEKSATSDGSDNGVCWVRMKLLSKRFKLNVCSNFIVSLTIRLVLLYIERLRTCSRHQAG